MPAPKGNQYAAKPDAEKKSFKGRLNCDLGGLKNRVVRAASARRMKLVDWVKEKLDQAARNDGF